MGWLLPWKDAQHDILSHHWFWGALLSPIVTQLTIADGSCWEPQNGCWQPLFGHLTCLTAWQLSFRDMFGYVWYFQVTELSWNVTFGSCKSPSMGKTMLNCNSHHSTFLDYKVTCCFTFVTPISIRNRPKFHQEAAICLHLPTRQIASWWVALHRPSRKPSAWPPSRARPCTNSAPFDAAGIGDDRSSMRKFSKRVGRCLFVGRETWGYPLVIVSINLGCISSYDYGCTYI